jgi:hypothetical protein
MADETKHELSELKDTLLASSEYKKWAEKNPGFYLVHMFLMSGHPPQLGYYNKKTDKIVTFDMHDAGKVTVNPASDVFKETGVVETLKPEEIKSTLVDAMAAAKQFVDEKHPGHIVEKNIVVLQMVKGKPVYNITLITRSFKTINVKIDAKSREIVDSQVHSILDLGVQE